MPTATLPVAVSATAAAMTATLDSPAMTSDQTDAAKRDDFVEAIETVKGLDERHVVPPTRAAIGEDHHVPLAIELDMVVGQVAGCCPAAWCRFWLRWSPALFR